VDAIGAHSPTIIKGVQQSQIRALQADSLNQDIVRVFSEMREPSMAGCGDTLVTLVTEREQREVDVSAGASVGNVVRREFGLGPKQFLAISLGGYEVAEFESFAENGIDDGARLDVRWGHATWDSVWSDLIAQNPSRNDAMRERRALLHRKYVKMNPDGTLGSSCLGKVMQCDRNGKGITLPESFGFLVCSGNLDLSCMGLQSLPDSFHNIAVGGDLSLRSNRLLTLPESIGELRVGRTLNLKNNQLTTVPESFRHIEVGPGTQIKMSGNGLKTLPNSPAEPYFSRPGVCALFADGRTRP